MRGALNAASIGRALLAVGAASVVIGLPLAIELMRNDEPVRGSGALAAAGETVVVTETVALLPLLPLYLDRGTLLSDAKTPKLDETINRLQIDNAVLRVPFGQPDGKASSKSTAPGLPTMLAQLASLNVASLIVRRSRLDFVTDNGTTYTLSDLAADIKTPRRGHYQATGTATFRGQKIRFEANWSAPHEKTDGKSRVVPIKLVVRASDLDAVFEGRASIGEELKLKGNADFRARRLRSLSRWFGLPVPSSTDLQDASISGDLDWSDAMLVFRQAVVTIDGNRGEGAVTLKTRGERPSIQGTLGFATFDVRPHLAALSSPPSGKQSGDAAESLQGSIATAFDADLRLSATKVVAPTVETGRGAVTVGLKNGRMFADLAELEVEGGIASGQLALDVTGGKPRVALKGKASGIDPGRPFTGWLKRNPLLGRGDATIEGSGNGHDLADIVAGFSGKGTFHLIEGGRLGLDLRALAYAAQNTKHVAWSAAGKGGTPLETLSARYTLSNGALTLDSLQARSGSTPISAGGKIDLASKLLDLQVVFAQHGSGSPNAPPSDKDVLVFRGDWADPAISVMGRPFTTTAPAKDATTGNPGGSPAADR